MRLELHLFLWVTAGAAVFLQLSDGLHLSPQVLSERVSMREQISDADIGPAKMSADLQSIRRRLGTVIYDQSVRPIFAVIAAPEDPSQAVFAPELALQPHLKGVLDGANGRRAVFSRELDGTEVVTASPGETIAAYRIEQVGEDFVTAVSPTGEVVRFELRGVGEGH